MEIKRICGFDHIEPFEPMEKNPFVEFLNNLGFLNSSINSLLGTFQIGEITVLGKTYRGILLKSDSKNPIYGNQVTIDISSYIQDAPGKALRFGVRITHGMPGNENRNVIGFGNSYFPFLKEELSYYCELVIYPLSGTNYYEVKCYYNGVLANSGRSNIKTVSLINFDYNCFTTEGICFSDIVISTIDYVPNGTEPPELLKDVYVESLVINGYSGDKHVNSKGGDILTSLKDYSPEHTTGVLLLNPELEPATITYTPLDPTGKEILAISTEVLYKDSSSGTRRLQGKSFLGNTAVSSKTATPVNDLIGRSVFSLITTTPPGGTWTEENTKLKLELRNV